MESAVYYEPLDVIPLWFIFISMFLISYTMIELGYRLGAWRRKHIVDEKETPVGAIIGTNLGLLAFLVGFTFSLAANRYEDRRNVVLEEANAIGTAYLRTSFLPEPQRNNSREMMREFVTLQIQGETDLTLETRIQRSQELLDRLWVEAVVAAQKNPTPITSLYVAALNEMIDLFAKRLQVAVRSRIPITILVGLFLFMLFGMASVGYQSGLSATRRSPMLFVLVLCFSGVMYLIADLDRSWEGNLRVNQQALIDTRNSMKPTSP